MPPFSTTTSEAGTLVAPRTMALATRLSSMLHPVVQRFSWWTPTDHHSSPHPERLSTDAEIVRLNRDRALVAAENQLLKEIVDQNGAASAMALLRRMIPHSSPGCAALVAVSDREQWTLASRGLLDSSVAALRLTQDAIERLQRESLLESRDDRDLSFLLSGLEPCDRLKARPLYLMATRDGTKLTGILLTSSLWPVGFQRQEQLDILSRAAQATVRSCLQEHQIRHHAEDLRLTRQMLALRSITDQATERPLETIGQFASRLCGVAEMDRATVFLIARRSADNPEPIVEAGVQMAASVLPMWKRHESLLAKFAMNRLSGCVLNEQHLAELGIGTLVGTAAVWPLVSDGRVLGAIVASRQSPSALQSDRLQLLDWSAGLLSKTLRRVYDDAAIRRQARHDGLTDLVNRRTFDNLLAGEIDRVRLGLSEDCSLLLADLDRFKSINDCYGHQAGDEVLRATAQLLREQVGRVRVGERSVLARYGGEELAVLLPGVGLAGALRMAEEIRAAIESRVVAFGSQQLRVTASIGVASCPRYGLVPAELISAADAALYRAKSEGRNRVCCPQEPAH